MKIFIISIITLTLLIILKSNIKLSGVFYQKVYTENFSFAALNNWYNSKFGSPLPFSDFINNSVPVFNEKLEYKSTSKYKDGVKLEVDYQYLVPALDSGIVIFIGDKDGYGKTVIVQQETGVDVWYSNLSEVNVKLYDYLTKSSLIGACDNYLYLVFTKDGEVVNYEEYI